MSEEKIYLIKNDHGEYLTVERTAPWWNSPVGTAVRNIDVALAWAEKYGGHVVTLVEEPEKVVLSKEQAKIVEEANKYKFPASYISMNTDDYDGLEKLLMNAYVNGYTVAKEKKYNVKVPHTKEVWYYKSGDTDLLTIFPADKELRGKFTESEIEHYGLQDCEKEEVTDDDD
ncbi:hypothetical protein HMPREF0539_0910 [Lacticaseibacillus rhamnosus LMS2-1]|uniref:DUF1642 domain-containing protein n=1 Tax=Lacticaseibacillus rhamnosus (strain LMS2-1) TaxID=525361 RepID=C2JVH6_LACRM|nr:DUF1642 domain-containing protein [Lacticaseibacillus rhamnosus]EEN80945.1 hypothetical protein HMPREF0539_0910 [Lacticaseibacillus rhamnosus LMS2-1]